MLTGFVWRADILIVLNYVYFWKYDFQKKNI